MITLDGARDVATRPRRGDVVVTAVVTATVEGADAGGVSYLPHGWDAAPRRVTWEEWGRMVRSGRVVLIAEQINAARARLGVSSE